MMEFKIAGLALFVGVILIFYVGYLHIHEKRRYVKYRDYILLFISLMDELSIDREATFHVLRGLKSPVELLQAIKRIRKSIKKSTRK